MDQVQYLSTVKVKQMMDKVFPNTLEDFTPTEKEELRRRIEEIHASYETHYRRQFRCAVKKFLGGEDEPTVLSTSGLGAEATATVELAENHRGDAATIRHLEDLQRLIKLYNVRPEAEDFSGQPIRLANKVNLPGPELIPENLKSIIEKKIALKEQEANHMLLEYSEKYGYHPLFRTGFREFFTT